MAKIIIKSRPVAADPGLGFEVDLSEMSYGTNPGQIRQHEYMLVRVEITVNYTNSQQQSEVECARIFVNEPIEKDNLLTVLLPFNCNDYPGASSLNLKITVQQIVGGHWQDISNGPTVNPYNVTLSGMELNTGVYSQI